MIKQFISNNIYSLQRLIRIDRYDDKKILVNIPFVKILEDDTGKYT